MAHYNFHQDLADGKAAEDEVAARLQRHFKLSDDDIVRSGTKEFDLKIKSFDTTFEVKNDLMAERTGNVAIEYECRGKPSGLAVTRAEFWVYKFSGRYWLASVEDLKKRLFVEKTFHRNVTGGDAGSYTKMMLVKVVQFQRWCIEL